MEIVRRSEYPLGAGWDPFRAMREMMRWEGLPLLREPFFREPWLVRAERDVWAPMFEVRENGQTLKLIADLPGVKKDDIEISVMGNCLTISGKREAEERRQDEQVLAYERVYGQFTRSFMLPEYVDVDQIKSQLDNGVLTIVVPKNGQTKSRKISIDGGTTA